MGVNRVIHHYTNQVNVVKGPLRKSRLDSDEDMNCGVTAKLFHSSSTALKRYARSTPLPLTFVHFHCFRASSSKQLCRQRNGIDTWQIVVRTSRSYYAATVSVKMPSIPQELHRSVEISQPSFPATTLLFTETNNNVAKLKLSTTVPCGSKMSSLEEVKLVWRMTDAVCFDVDSTVCQDEAIDELAKFCGKEKEICQITKTAMSGKMDFRTALKTRLSIIKPTYQQLESYIEANPPKLTPGIRELIGKLHQLGIPVYLVSGGFHSIITSVAKELSIPLANVHANHLKFFFDGSYAGFDEDQPVSRSGGKAEVVKNLKERHGYTNLVMIGDGATDLHTCPPADAFIGFGGNQARDEVKKHAKWFAMNFKELLDELNAVPASCKTK